MENYENQNVLPLIQEYIEDKITEYAILIDGEWGCGKTYFYDKKVEQLIKSLGKIPIYVSLYGALTVKEVENNIHAKIIEAEFPENQAIQIVKKAGKIICEVVSSCKDTIEATTDVNLPNVTPETIYNIMKIVDNYRNYVFIFDDLERCNIPICSILGYINDWMEHKHCKCIIIANQEEVTNRVLFNNLEGKLSVALEKMKFQNKEKNNEVSIKDMVEEAKQIFNNNNEYNQIREKLIGQVIYYKPNFDEVFKNILLNDRLNIETIAIVRNEQKMLIKELVGNKHINIRTLRAIIFNFDKVIKAIANNECKDNPNYETVMSHILHVVAKSTIRYKKGNIIDNKNDIPYMIFKEEHEDKFKFIDKLVKKGFIDETLLNQELEAYFIYESEQITDSNDPIRKITDMYMMDDCELIHIIEDLLNKLKKGKYAVCLYPKILSYLVRMKMMGFDEKYLNEAIDAMKCNIKKHYEVIDIREYGLYLETKEQKDEYDRAIRPIQEAVAKNNPVNEVNNIIEQNGWGEAFYEYVMNHRGDFIQAQKFLAMVDIDNFIRKIGTFRAKDIFMFRCTLIELYQDGNLSLYFKDDLVNLQKLDELISNLSIEEYGITIKWNIAELSSDVKKAIRNLTNQQ